MRSNKKVVARNLRRQEQFEQKISHHKIGEYLTNSFGLPSGLHMPLVVLLPLSWQLEQFPFG